MALQTKVGSFVKGNTVGTQAITGLGFTPKAIIFWTNGGTAAAGTWESHHFSGLGFTAGPANSYAISAAAVDGLAASNTARRMAAKAITSCNANAGLDFEADLASFNADGFTLNWTTNMTYPAVINYMALGGDDITGAKVVNWTAPTAAGFKSVTGLGFKPDLVLHSTISNNTIPVSANQAYFAFGAMNKHGQQFANSYYSQDAVSPSSNTSRFQQTDACIAATDVSEGNSIEAQFYMMDADGFTLNFFKQAYGSSYLPQMISLCLKGVSSKIGSFRKTVDLVGGFNTVTAAAGTANKVGLFNQRTLAEFSNGNLIHAPLWSDGYPRFFISPDKGKTWVYPANGPYIGGAENYSMFVDQDDYVHVAWKQSGAVEGRTSGWTYYMRGTPNADRTAVTFGTVVQVQGNTLGNYPDLVAHREGTGWVVHIVNTYQAANNYNSTSYWRVTLNSSGVSTQIDYVDIGSAYNSGSLTHPSVDFHHTGDGKTVQGGTPHVYVGWTAGVTGAGKGIRFRKATYSAGSWTWGPEREIDSTRTIQGGSWLSTMFDGTRVITGLVTGSNGWDLVLYERDVADTTTITRILFDNDDGTKNGLYYNGQMTYDTNGNVYFAGGDWNSGLTRWGKWTRATETLSAPAHVESSAPHAVSMKRGSSGDRVEWVYSNSGADRWAGINTATGALLVETSVQRIDRVGFTPKALLTSGVSQVPLGAPGPSALWWLGGSDGASSRVVALSDIDAVNPTQVKSAFRNDRLVLESGSGTTFSQASLKSLDQDGFSLLFDVNPSTSTEIAYLALGDSGSVSYPIDLAAGHSGVNDATASSPQRKLDRCQNGNLVALWRYSGGNADFRVSVDNGVTWAIACPEIAGVANGSIFIDLDDYMHFVWKQTGNVGALLDGYIYYMRGTPNAARTSWTWSAAQSYYADVAMNYPDIVAHREGTGWVAHVVVSYVNAAASAAQADYGRYTITSGGAISLTRMGMSSVYSFTGALHQFPSIDFNHTGDGKTVAGNTPHLYAAWSAGKTGAGFGIRFRKATYSGGSWTWGTEREITSSWYTPNQNYSVSCLFDGTRVIIGGAAMFDGGSGYATGLWERDAADTTTTLIYLVNEGVYNVLYAPSMTYDKFGNVYLIGSLYQTGGYYAALSYRKYTRAWGKSLGKIIQLESEYRAAPYYPSMKRGYSGDRIEWIYSTGNNNKYPVKYEAFVYNVALQDYVLYVPQIML